MANYAHITALGIVCDVLAAEDYFADIGIYRQIDGGLYERWGTEERIGVINDGAFVIVRVPDATQAVNQEQQGPHFTGIPIIVSVFTNDHRNETGKENNDICEVVIATLHRNPLDNLAQDAVHDERPIRLVGQGDGWARRDCFLWCGGGVTMTQPQIATPGISGTDTITLTCATAGAAIFYTTDGSRPSPQNGTFYSAPFALASGLTVKASAWLAGYSTSAEASYTRP